MTVVRDAADPNLVIVMTRFDSVAAAKGMFASERFQALARTAGSPILEAHFTEVAEDSTY